MTTKAIMLCQVVLALLVGLQHTDAESNAEIARLGAIHEEAVKAQNAGRYADAERLHRQVVQGLAQIPDYPLNERARQLSNLASVLNLRGKPREALDFLGQAQKLLEKHPSTDPAQYAVLQLNLGKAHALGEAWGMAEEHYKTGIDILAESGLSEGGHQYDATAGLAYVYWKTGRLSEAKPLYETALEFFRGLVGPDHPAVKKWEREYQQVIDAIQQHREDSTIEKG